MVAPVDLSAVKLPEANSLLSHPLAIVKREFSEPVTISLIAKDPDEDLEASVEVVGIGLAGGVLGLLLSMLGLWGVRAMYAKGFGNLGSVAHLDWTMVWIALGLSALAGILAGLYPALRVGRVQPASYLKTQ